MSLKKLVDLDLLGRAVTKIKALIPNAASAAPGKVASSSSQGSSANYARQDHTHGIDLATGDANGQVKIAGNNVSVKGLAALAYKASLGKSDVGLGNVDNVKQYSASNPPPYPVTSVNGSTGAVTVSVPSAGTATPKMDGTAAVGSSAKYAKEDHVHPSDTTRVATTGDQTVAGNKTFSGTTSLTADSIYPASTGTAIPANSAAIIQSPIPKYLWHDVFAFCRDCTPTYYTTADGSTWTQSTLEKNLFIHKMTWGRQNVISDTVKGSRWIWDTGAWNYGSCAWLLIGFSYTAKNAYFDILLEQSDSSGNWTTLLTKSNCYYNSVPVWFKTNGPQDGTQIRLTIIRNSSDTTTNALPVTSIKWLASRWGDQGRGEELEYPYQWDADNNILPVANNTNSLGSSSYKWKNINVGQLNGTTIPDSPKFTDTTALGSMTGTLGVDHGGTGKTTANDAANVFMNALGTGSSTPVDADYYISQYVGGGTTTTTYHRRPMSALWEYIKGKISSVLGLTASSYGGSAAKVNNHTVAVDVPSNAKFTDTTYSAGDGLIQNGTTFSDHRGIEYIRGTWTAASGTWTGVSTDTELYDGKQIILYMPFGGSGNATLNLTLAGGGTTGAKDVYFESTTRFTTHKGQNSQLHLIYHNAFTLSNGTTYQGWWYVNNRDTTNVSQLSRVYNSIKAKAAIYRYQILLTYDGEYLLPVSNGNNNTATNKTMTTEKFDPFGQIYYWSSTTTVSANAKINDWNQCMSHYNNGLIDLRYAFNTGTTLTTNKAIYLVCVPQSDGSAKLHTTPISQTLPTSEDGRIYKYLGQAYDTYRITLDEDKPCYYYKNGSLRLWTNQDTNAATVNGHTVAVDVPSGAKFTDTTYESKAAASGGTAVSLVTTGEKYTWNNKGTYSKPSGGIPDSDIASAATWNAKGNGTITGIKMNGASKGTSGVVDLGTVITSHQSLSGKQDKITASGVLKGNGSGTISAATKGTDFGALSFTVSLTVAGWSNNAQTITNSNFVTSGYAYIVTPASGSYAAYVEAQIYADNVTTASKMTFHCSNAPSAALTVNVLRVVSA